MKRISINKFPIFNQYLYEFIKSNIDSSCSFDFISQNIDITGYCQCGLKGCATIHLESKVPLPQYKKVYTASKNQKLQRLHFDSNDILREFEYIEKSTIEEVPFKQEVVNIF
jgi:hypothetical protein